MANGRYFGGGMHIAPRAELDDGLFDVVIVEHRNPARTVAQLPSLYRGTHLEKSGIRWLRGSTVRVESPSEPMLFDLEGEQIGTTPATLTCLSHALRLLVPTHHPGSAGA